MQPSTRQCRTSTVRLRVTSFYVVGLVAIVVLAGCRADVTGVDATEILPSSEPLADLRLGDESVAPVESDGSGAISENSLGDDSFGSLSLLAPTLPGFGLDTYSTSCDPFEDPYGACL
jgi:hypothetical protein